MGVGLQLYTVRDDMAKDFKGTLRAVADMGYEGVEFAGYGDVPAAEMKQLLDSLGLKAFGSHIGLARLEEDLQGEIDYLNTIGATYAIVPHLSEKQRADWSKLFAQFAFLGEEMNKHGLQFAYHNHAFEFEEKRNGNYVFDEMYKEVDASLLKVEMDIGWVQYAGEQPVDYIRKYAGRLPLLHLKDFRKGEPGTRIDTVELGRGDLDLADVIGAASDAGVEWLIVEQDRCENPPLQSVQTSLEWLKQHYLAKF